MLLAGVVFSVLMCMTHFFSLDRRVSSILTVLTMLGLLFLGNSVGKSLEEGPFIQRFRVFAALFFTALLLSSLRLQFLRLALMMMGTFLVLYLLVGVLPSLAAKYEIGTDDMPFAAWLSVGLLSTMLIKGSFLYLILF